jgi:type II secretory pathway component GspD/PulD (secretin)
VDRHKLAKLRLTAILIVGIGILTPLLLSRPADGQFDFVRAKSVSKELVDAITLHKKDDYEAADPIFERLKDCQMKLTESQRKDLAGFSVKNKIALKGRADGHEQLLNVKNLLRQNKPHEALPILNGLVRNRYLNEADRKDRDELWNRLNNVPAGNYKELMSQAHKAYTCKDYPTAIQLAREAQKAMPIFIFVNPLDTPAKLIHNCEKAMEREQLAPPLQVPLPGPTPMQEKKDSIIITVPPSEEKPVGRRPEEKKDSGMFQPFKFLFPSKEPPKDGPELKDAPKYKAPPPTIKDSDGPPLPLPSGDSTKVNKTSLLGDSVSPFTPRMSGQDLPPGPPPGVVNAGGPIAPGEGVVPAASFGFGPADKAAAEELAQKRAYAQQLLKDGYNALALGDLDKARQFAVQANELKLTYSRSDLSPDKLMAEVLRQASFQPKPEPAAKSGPATKTDPSPADKLPDAAKNADPDALPPPNKEGKVDPKTMVRQARELLNKEKFDDAEKLINLAADARPKGWGLFEDSPDKLRNDLKRIRNHREREEAARNMLEGRKLFNEGKLDEAKVRAYNAQRLHGAYGVMDLGDRPQRLLDDIFKAEQKLAKDGKKEGTSPFAEANRNKNKTIGKLVSRTVENEKKARAVKLLVEAREYQTRGLLPEARARAIAAAKEQAEFSANEESPESLLSILTAQCGNTLNMLLQQALEQSSNASDPARFEKSLFILKNAQQLCAAFEMDPNPIEQRIAQVQQQQGSPGGNQQKVVSQSQIQGLEKLEKARLELKNGNTALARRLAEEAFDPRFGVREEAEKVLRSIDGVDSDRALKTANRDAQTAINAFYSKDFRRAAALFATIDMRMLTPENLRRTREILGTAEMQRENLAKSEPAKDRFAEDPKGAPGKLTITDQNPQDGFKTVQAMEKIQYEYLRNRSMGVQRSAMETFKSEPEQAVEMLKDFLAKLDETQLDATQQASIRRPIESRINQYRFIILQKSLEKDKLAEVKPGHDEDKRNLDIKKTQDDVSKLINVEFRQLYKEGKYLEAEIKCRQVLELDPDNVAATIGMELCKKQFLDKQWKSDRLITQDQFTKQLRPNFYPHTTPTTDDPLVFGNDPKSSSRLQNRVSLDKGLSVTARTPVERAIEFKLRQPISVNFHDTELRQVLATLKALTGLNIVPDKAAMDEMGIGLDQRLNLENVENIQLRSALNLLLKQINMTYIIRDEVVQITTEMHARGNRVPKVYTVADLVVPIRDYPTSGIDSFHDAMQRHINNSSGIVSTPNVPMTPPYSLPPGQAVSTSTGGLGRAVAGSTDGSDSSPNAALAQQLMNLIQNTVSQNSWAQVGGQATINFFPLGMALIINQTEEAHEEISGLLSQLRKTQEVQVAIEMRLLSVSEQFYEYMNVNFDLNFKSKNGNTVTNVGNNITGVNNLTFGQTPAGSLPDLSIPLQNMGAAFAIPAFAGLPGAISAGTSAAASLAFLNDIQVYLFMEAARGDKRTNIMQAPKLTVVNASTANITINDQIFFTTGASMVQGQGQMVFMPQNNPFPVGINLQVTPVVSADRRFVRLHLVPTMTNLVSTNVPTIPVQIPVTQVGAGGVPVSSAIATMYFQQPSFSTISLNTTVNVPDGGTVLLGGLKTLAESRNETGPPVLADLPYLNRLFRNTSMTRDAHSLMIMVTPRIIINEEEEQNYMGQMPPLASRR